MYADFSLRQITFGVAYKLHNPTKEDKNRVRLCWHILGEKIKCGDIKNVSIMLRLPNSDSVLPMSYPRVIFLSYF